MVKVPTYTRDVSLRPAYRQGVDVHATPESFGAAAGRGMEQFAKGLGSLGDAMTAVNDLQDETLARQKRNEFMRAKDELALGDGGYLTTEGENAVNGFDAYKSKLGTLKREYSSSLTPAQQKLFDKAIAPVETDALRSALRHKAGALKKFTIDAANSGVSNFQSEAVKAFDDPATAQKYMAAGLSEIDGLAEKLGWPAEAVTAKKREFVSATVRLTAAEMANADPVAALEYVTKHREAMSPEDHLAAMTALSKAVVPAATRDAVSVPGRKRESLNTGDLVSRIVSVESGGKADAKNPNSSASGLGQFLDGTWLTMIKRHRPDLAEGKSDKAILALKTNAALGREMTARYAEENAATLRAAGIQATPGNVYLAHFLGPAGANTVLGAGDEKQLSELLPAAVLKANPFLKGHDAAWLKQWADGKMVGAAAGAVKFSPRVEKMLSDLPGNYAERIRESAAAGVSKMDAAADAQAKAQRAALVDSYKLRIADGDVSLSRDEILKDPTLDNGDKATLLNAHATKFNDALETRQAVAAFQAGQFAIDPYDSDGKKLVDNVWKSLSGSVDKDHMRATLEGLVQQTGLVPSPVVHAIRGELASKSPQTVASAAQLAVRLSAINPAALERRDGGKQVQDTAAMFQHLTETVGLEPAAAAQRIIDARDPEKHRERDALLKSDVTTKFVKGQAVEANVRDIFDPGLFGFDPKLGETPAQSAAMVSDYKDMLTESLVDTAGDQDLAKTLAANRFKRLYGVSKFAMSGDKVVMRLPPEVTYPAGADGTRDYIRKQAKDALKKAGVSAKEVYLQADDLTEQDAKAGKPARYELWYRDANGVLDRYHLPFFAVSPTKEEIAAARKAEHERRRDENMKRLENERWLNPPDPLSEAIMGAGNHALPLAQ